MPRISLYRENKTNDYRFFDQRIYEQFTMGGTVINIHKYLGVKPGGDTSPGTPQYDTFSEQNIQDLLFLENRDRKYDTDIYSLRGIYNVSDIDFDLSQFGLFLQNDTLFIVFHLNDMVERLGRKIMAGDVLELPHLREFYPLDSTLPAALRRYYVVQDAARASEGYSPTWLPHLWRVKAAPLVSGQEYQDLLNNLDENGDPIVDGEENGNTLGDLLTSYKKEIEINDAIIAQAIADVPESGYDTRDLYTLPVRDDGSPSTYEAPTADTIAVLTDSGLWTADKDLVSPKKSAYDGYLTGDGYAPNGHPVVSAITFPTNPQEGDFVLRLDYMPNRLFRFNGRKWVKIEDDVRVSYRPQDSGTQVGTFINNDNEFSTDDGQRFESNQLLSEVIKPKADN